MSFSFRLLFLPLIRPLCVVFAAHQSVYCFRRLSLSCCDASEWRTRRLTKSIYPVQSDSRFVKIIHCSLLFSSTQFACVFRVRRVLSAKLKQNECEDFMEMGGGAAVAWIQYYYVCQWPNANGCARETRRFLFTTIIILTTADEAQLLREKNPTPTNDK